MLIEFSVGNYRSYQAINTLSMVAATITSQPPELDVQNVIDVLNGPRLLTSAAIYGANASGKSNFIKALHFMRQFVLASSRETQIAEMIQVEHFRLSLETDGRPSHFEVVFLLDGRQYRYGFEVTVQRVVAEWLYTTPTTREARLFERHDDDINVNARWFKEGRGLEARTRNNALFLSVVAQFNGTIAQDILRWFSRLSINTGIGDMGDMLLAMRQLDNPRYKQDIVSFVKKLDIGIDDLSVERLSGGGLTDLPSGLPDEVRNALETILRGAGDTELFSVKTMHKKYDSFGGAIAQEFFDLEQHESEGTQKLFTLAYPITRALRNGLIFVIDEFDARLHPLITREIIRLFTSKTTNPKGAQLIFTTHNTLVLGSKLLRRDQIWFVEKAKQGASELYSLVEYRLKRDDVVPKQHVRRALAESIGEYRLKKGDSVVRNDASFEKQYIEGRYGAVPFIGDFEHLLGAGDDQEPG